MMKSPNQTAIEALPRYEFASPTWCGSSLPADRNIDPDGEYVLLADVLAAITPPVQGSIDADGLPPLPEPVCTKPASGQLFDADQMRAYALADRAARQSAAPDERATIPRGPLNCHLSWGGKNVYGDEVSIAAVKIALHEAETVPELKERISEEITQRASAQPAGVDLTDYTTHTHYSNHTGAIAPTPLAAPAVQGSVDERAAFDIWWSKFQSAHEDWLFADADAIRWAAYQAGSAVPAPSEPVPPKDHTIAAVVNNLRDIAIEFHATGQLRERLSRAIAPLLGGPSEPVPHSGTPCGMVPGGACWSCKKQVTLAQRSDADGDCPHCGIEIDMEDGSTAPTATSGGEAVEPWEERQKKHFAGEDYSLLDDEHFMRQEIAEYRARLAPPSLPAAEAASVRDAGWVSVDERLPPLDVAVLALTTWQEVVIEEWVDYSVSACDMNQDFPGKGLGWCDNSVEDVTHWMPLCRLPRQGRIDTPQTPLAPA